MSNQNSLEVALRKYGGVVMLTILLFIISRYSNVRAYELSNSTKVEQNEYETVYSSKYIEINNEATKIKDYNKNNTVLENLLIAITGKVNAKELILAGEKLGYIANEEKSDNILKLVSDIHINELGLKKENIISVEVKCNMELIEKKVDVSTIESKEELAIRIYNKYKLNDKDMDIIINVVETNDKIIIPGTTISSDPELYLGETKQVKGESGIKQVKTQITYVDKRITDSKIIDEKIIKESKSTDIRRGIKNPYDYGVAFLSYPTRGGYMTSEYGERWNSFHKGIDIAGDIGDDVIVAMNGEVIYAQYNDGGYGNLIKVKHEEDMVTYYAHLSDFYVKVGDKVEKGAKIGAIGNTGYSTGPHLHFELRVNDEPVNPTKYIVQ